MELPSKSSVEAEQSVEFWVSSFLDAHKTGLRNPDSTLRNLSNVYGKLSEKERERFYELLVSAYKREPFSEGTPANYVVSVPSIILHAVIAFGPVTDFIPRMLDHLMSLKPEGMEEWAKAVAPVFQYELYHSADRFDDKTLDLIGGFRGRLSKLGGEGQAFPVQLVAAAKDLERVVADIKLKKLEKTTTGSETLAGEGLKKKRPNNSPPDVSAATFWSPSGWLGIRREYGISKSTFGKRISFITDRFKRTVIFRDIEQAYVLANYGFHKPAVILAGGVIEELLRFYLAHKKVAADSDSLDSYIKACEKYGLLKGAIHKLADSIRQFRNIVHLEKESSPKHAISKATAKGAVASVFTVANDFDR